MTSPGVASPIISSKTVTSRSSAAIPSPVDAFPCGSKSISRIFWPASAKAAPMLIVVVVLPTPPFWFATAMILARPRGLLVDTANIPQLDNSCNLVCHTGLERHVKVPILLCFAQFIAIGLAFRENGKTIVLQVPFCHR